MARRFLTIVGRNGKTVITDSKPNPNKPESGTYYEYGEIGDTMQLSFLKAWNSKLSEIPRGIKFKDPVTFLIPNSIAFLAYQDTRKIWCAGTKKSGEEIAPEVVEQVQLLDKQLDELVNCNIEVYGQDIVMSNRFNSFAFKSQVSASWNLMDQLVPRADSYKAF